ncbi:phage/plasmid primase, P4 family [Tepidibacter hydrothermalis]|uniref:Phage/plasmid primase, P4 family n=1 Tax=Tepidibacter hydrothermalis TaxID=3036126 RepID=A0ABY8EH10_9FIRM|nr:phage/plasmid primase, P4 family [Tepidibacter hydrothermalis]WFD12233.1 phage/plasmid primase, P4 family [Tepidibacter hydrothermalis]
MFFKGYVETKNKKCIEKFKGRTDFKSYEQVQSLSEFAGILDAETILIDVDDFDQSEILFKIVQEKNLKCRVYETTRGKHFLFKNKGVVTNRTHANLAIGITADIKIGKRNSYSILKFKDKERKILYDTTGENEEAQDLPKWLLPIKTNTDFIEMKAGDGRNQALFNYILTLQSNDFEVEQARETIRIINEFVLKVPLSEDEIEIILRDDAFSKPVFFKGSTFLFDKFAIYLKNNHHIKRINNQLHLYKDGIYISGLAEIEAEMIRHIPQLNRAKRTEVLSYLDILIRENTQATEANWIAFRNGLLNIYDDTFVPFSHEHVITNKIDWDYNPNAYDELTDKTLDRISCNDKQIRMLLEEMVGYTMFRRNELGKAFILTGTGSNGKSTFLNMLKTMLGKRNVSVLDLKKLNDRFSTVMMYGKLANVGDDISEEFVTDAAEFKKIVTGETIDCEQKGQPKFEFEPYVKLLFSANNIPRIGKGRDSYALLRRLIIVPFNAKFSSSDPDYVPFIGDKLQSQEAIEYFIQLGLKALKRVLIERKFTESEQVQRELEEFEENNNPILGFFKETDKDEIENEPTNQAYKAYQEYCLANSLQPLSNGEFSKQVKRHFDFIIADKKINGKKYRIFVSK